MYKTGSTVVHLELTAGLQLLYLDLLQHCNEAVSCFFGYF